MIRKKPYNENNLIGKVEEKDNHKWDIYPSNSIDKSVKSYKWPP